MFALKRSSLRIIESIVESKNDADRDAVIAYAMSRGAGAKPENSSQAKRAKDGIMRLAQSAFPKVMRKFREAIYKGQADFGDVNISTEDDIATHFFLNKLDRVVKSYINANHPGAKRAGGSWARWQNLDWSKLKSAGLEGLVVTALSNDIKSAIDSYNRYQDNLASSPRLATGKRDPETLGSYRVGGRTMVDKAAKQKEKAAVRRATKKALERVADKLTAPQRNFLDAYLGTMDKDGDLKLSGFLAPRKGGGSAVQGVFQKAINQSQSNHRAGKKALSLFARELLRLLRSDPVGKSIFPTGYKLESRDMTMWGFLSSVYNLDESIGERIDASSLVEAFLFAVVRY